jgi:methionyl-tRNA synthetase
VNNVPHLGNIIGCVLSADVYARYCRSRKREVLYICGTDEYGTATEAKALEEGITPKELCDRYYILHKNIYEWFGISTDIFGRTSTPLHTKITQEIFLDLYKNGFIIEEEIEQAYDEKAKMFLADRFIEGTCPHCGYDGARADQCEKCGKLLNFDELKNPKSKLTGAVPTRKRTKHLFLDLPKLQAKLEEWIGTASKDGGWTENSVKIARAWCAEGLKKRCITRDLKWGVPVPLDGWQNKVFYVWFDAPIGYISITANLTNRWKEWWQNPSEVQLYQFMGKDNVPFHTVVFPSTLMGTGKNWTLLNNLSTTEFLNFEGGKFSKSKGTGVFGNDAMDSGIPADVWRYYLLTNRPEKMDTDFTWQDFGEKLNNEILANIGNLANRTLVFTEREFGGTVPDGKPNDDDLAFISAQKGKFEKIAKHLDNVQIKDALHTAMEAGKEANAYFQRSAPWKTAKEDRARCEASIYVLLHQVKDLAIALEPFLPHTSADIFSQLGIEPEKWDGIGKLTLAPGQKLGKPQIIFKKLEPAQLSELARKYSGKQGKPDAKGVKKGSAGEKEAAPASSSTVGNSLAEGRKRAPDAAPIEPLLANAIDFEVGKILSVEKHPDATKLYIEKIELGDGVRQIVSGIAPYFTIEELIGKKVIIVKNLKPAKLRGVESAGMLLATEKEGKLELVSPDWAEAGDKVELKGQKMDPKKELSIERFATVNLEAKGGIVRANGVELVVKGKPVVTRIILDGKVK